MLIQVRSVLNILIPFKGFEISVPVAIKLLKELFLF